MNDQPEALRLADEIAAMLPKYVTEPAAACLRRQHAEIERLYARQTDYEDAIASSKDDVAMLRECVSAVSADRERLRAECDALKKLLDQHEAALKMWLDKTEWVQGTRRHGELGLHRADAMNARLIRAEAERNALRAELLSIGDLDKRHAIVRKWGLSEWADWAQNRARYATREEDRDE